MAELTDRIKTRLLRERDAEIEKIRLASAKREVTIRQEAAKAAEAVLAPQIEKARKDAAAQVDKVKRDAAAREAAVRQAAAKAATAALAPKIAEAVNTEKQRSYHERLQLTEQLEVIQRKLEKQTAGELGEEAEVDLFEALRREFSGDQIVRVPKGRNGADILHDVIHQGVVVGWLVLDSKNHGRWSSRFVSKLASDLVVHRGDHAIPSLSSSAFSAGAPRQLHVIDRVIIAHPARLVVLAMLLRRQIIAAHVLRLGNTERNEKRDKLYDFIVSDRCSQLLDRIGSLSDDVLELDAKEESTHRTVWRKRTDLVKAIQSANNEFLSEIETLIGGAGSAPPP
jgi:hypothetical protein